MWTYLLLTLIFGFIIGLIITRLILSKKLKNVAEINQSVKEENDRARIELNRTQVELESARKQHSDLCQQQNDLSNTLSELTTKIKISQEEADSAVKTYYDRILKAAKQNIQLDIEQLEADYTKAEREYQKEYLATLEEAVENLKNEISSKTTLTNELTLTLNELQDKVNAAVEANKRAVEKEQKKDFYRLVISDIDAEEIRRLREVVPYLRDSEPLNKVIWKVYYERPYTDLIGRVVGSGVHCGIYKITNIDNQMCYVGQAVNIADRWKQHIKRGLGADTPTRNKLYPAMMASGVENFTFEIVEECPREKLNEREDYWQDYFKAKEFGYSIK
jgi:uncharacterized membrane-anchored protein YhcB (DUF1043 family)